MAAKLGSGERFKAVEESAEKSGARNPAAAAGMKKWGKDKMEKMARAGKKKTSRSKGRSSGR